MQLDCNAEEPPEHRIRHLDNLVGTAIALMTLILPLYITAYYSSNSATENTTAPHAARSSVFRRE